MCVCSKRVFCYRCMRVNVYEHTGRRSFILNLANKFGGNRGNPTTKITASSNEKIFSNCFFLHTISNKMFTQLLLNKFFESNMWLQWQDHSNENHFKTQLCLNFFIDTMYNSGKKKFNSPHNLCLKRTTCFGANTKNGRFAQSFHMCLRCVDVSLHNMCTKKKCACKKEIENEKKMCMLIRAKARKKK